MASTDPLVTSQPARKTPGGGLYAPAVGLLLRVTKRAWKQLGIAAADRWLPDASDAGRCTALKNVYARTFWSKCTTPGALGGIAKALHDIHPGLYRFSTGAEPRTVVWHDQDGGVVWLCAGLSFPDGDPSHTALYDEVKRLLRLGRLLPTAVEVAVAHAERFWLGVVDELAYALRRAEQEPETWNEAHVATDSGRQLRYGAFFVQEVPFPGEGVILVRHFIVLRHPPEDVPHPERWREIMIAELFPEGGPVSPVYDSSDLPPGAPLTPDDVIIVHEVEYEDTEAEGG